MTASAVPTRYGPGERVRRKTCPVCIEAWIKAQRAVDGRPGAKLVRPTCSNLRNHLTAVVEPYNAEINTGCIPVKAGHLSWIEHVDNLEPDRRRARST